MGAAMAVIFSPCMPACRGQGRINLYSVDCIITRLWTARFGFPFPAEAGHFSHLRIVQSVSGAHPVSYAVGTGGLSPM
jgi:hypothetical protein